MLKTKNSISLDSRFVDLGNTEGRATDKSVRLDIHNLGSNGGTVSYSFLLVLCTRQLYFYSSVLFLVFSSSSLTNSTFHTRSSPPQVHCLVTYETEYECYVTSRHNFHQAFSASTASDDSCSGGVGTRLLRTLPRKRHGRSVCNLRMRNTSRHDFNPAPSRKSAVVGCVVV